jgi:hypothetical protein
MKRILCLSLFLAGIVPSLWAQAINSQQENNIRRIGGGMLADWEDYLNIVGMSQFESEYANLDLSIFENPAVPSVKPDYYADENKSIDRNPQTPWDYLTAKKTRLGNFSVVFSEVEISPIYRTNDDPDMKMKIDFTKKITYESMGTEVEVPPFRQTMFFTIKPDNLNDIKIKGIRYFDPTLQIVNLNRDQNLIEVFFPDVEVLVQSKQYIIRWQDRIPEDVKIELVKNSEVVALIAENVPSQGSYNWTIGPGTPTGGNFRVKISSMLQPNVFAISTRPFTIVPPSTGDARPMRILKPTTGEKLRLGKIYPLVWENPTGLNINIDLYQDNRYVRNIANNIEDKGTFPWRIPPVVGKGKNFDIRIYPVAQPTRVVNTGRFSITKKGSGGAIALVSLGVGGLIAAVLVLLAQNDQPEEALPAFPNPG